METITIEINKQSAAGKTLLGILDYFAKNSEGVKIKNGTKTPNDQVLKTFRDIDAGKNLIDTENYEDLMDKLYS